MATNSAVKKPLVVKGPKRSGLRRRGPGAKFALKAEKTAKKRSKPPKKTPQAISKAAREAVARKLLPSLAMWGSQKAALAKGIGVPKRSLQRSIQLVRAAMVARAAKKAKPAVFERVRAVYQKLHSVAEGPRDVSAAKVFAELKRLAKTTERVPSMRCIGGFIQRGRALTAPAKWSKQPPLKPKDNNDPGFVSRRGPR